MPDEIRRGDEIWQRYCVERRLWRHQGVPLFPLRSLFPYLLAAVALSAVVLPGLLVQALPMGMALLAGNSMADDTNVIALWRILIGVPVALLWNAALVAVLLGTGTGWWLLPCWIFSMGMLFFWYRWKKTMVVAWNGIWHGDLRADALAWRAATIKALGR
jgi:hypothetical protein